MLENIFDYLLTPPYLWMGVAVLILLGLLWVLLRRQPHAVIAFKSQNGNVMVSRKAINDLALRVCESIEAIKKCVLHVKTQRGILHIAVRLRLTANSKLNEISDELQRRLYTALQENLGIEKLGPIDIVVTGFVGQAEPAFPSSEEPLKPEVFSSEVSEEKS